MKNRDLAAILERKGAESGEYPPDWAQIAQQVKTVAGWQCERCGKSHEKDGKNGFVLTTHHLDGNKQNCEWWNLAALCQRCHLRIQSRVNFNQVPRFFDWDTVTWVERTEHSLWMARHIKSYNVWAMLMDKEPIPLEKITERDYSKEWAK